MRVYYEDTDAAGIVYHANYLKFAERGRTEFLRSVGFDHRLLAEVHGLVFAVARCVTDFVSAGAARRSAPGPHPGPAARGARLELEQTVLRGEATIASLEVTLAILDRVAMRPKRLPEALRLGFAAYAKQVEE